MPKSWTKLDELRKESRMTDNATPLPAGAFTIQEYAKRYRVSSTTARRQLKEMKDLKKLGSAARVLNRVSVLYYWPI